MNDAQISNIKSYIQKSARPLDVALFKYVFEDGPADDIVVELKKFQNSDHGFGHGLEPDIQSPSSSVLCTTVALQYLNYVKTEAGNQLAVAALTYLDNNFDINYLGWHPVGPDIENAPHAPWWDYINSLSSYEWGNPSAEILGYYIKYEYSGTEFSTDQAIEKTISELQYIAEPEVHAVLCYLRTFKVANGDIKQQMKDTLFSHIKKIVSLNSSQWKNYVPKPLDFLKRPDDEVATLFSSKIIRENINFIKQSLLNDHWEPNWNWGDQHPGIWQDAKKDWSGKITVENLLLLDSFKDLL